MFYEQREGSGRICRIKSLQARAKRAKCPTYKAGLPACSQGAVGRVLAGLRVGGKVKKVSCEKPLKRYLWKG